jgi:hypothetical protein
MPSATILTETLKRHAAQQRQFCVRWHLMFLFLNTHGIYQRVSG